MACHVATSALTVTTDTAALVGSATHGLVSDWQQRVGYDNRACAMAAPQRKLLACERWVLSFSGFCTGE
jgi:hypothetical protein